MILDDLFEMQPSDIPTYLRRQQGRPDLTMRDIEQEKPKGAFRYKVGEKEFMNLDAATEFAKGTNQQVQLINWATPKESLTEQEVDFPASMNPQDRGQMILDVLQADKRFARMSRRPIRINMAGEQFLIQDPEIKNAILTMAATYQKKGALPQFMLNLGQPDSLHFLLSRLDTNSDTSIGGQYGTPRSQRFAAEATAVKKKTDSSPGDLSGQDLSARTQRILSQLRASQPQAQSDVEALIYDIRDQRKKDQADIDRLEDEVDNLEKDIKKDLGVTIKQLRGRKGSNIEALRQIQSSDQEQAAAIQRILQIDRQQQQAINDLERKSASTPTVSATKIDVPTASKVAAAAAQPTSPAPELPSNVIKMKPSASPADLPQAVPVPAKQSLSRLKPGQTAQMFTEPVAVKKPQKVSQLKKQINKKQKSAGPSPGLIPDDELMVAEDGHDFQNFIVSVKRSGADERPITR